MATNFQAQYLEAGDVIEIFADNGRSRVVTLIEAEALCLDGEYYSAFVRWSTGGGEISMIVKSDERIEHDRRKVYSEIDGELKRTNGFVVRSKARPTRFADEWAAMADA